MHANITQSLIVMAGICHAVQVPALVFASRAVAWDSGSMLARRIEAVLAWSVPMISMALLGLMVGHWREVFSLRLGQCLSLLLAGQWLLIAYGAVNRRSVTAPGRRFANLRREISYTLLGLGFIVVSNAQAIGTTRLGAFLCLGLGILYAVRGTLQIVCYGPVWPSGSSVAFAHWVLVALFATQSTLYTTVGLRFFRDAAVMARVA